LELEDWEIELEFETEQQAEKRAKSLQKKCFRCKSIMFGDTCAVCGFSTGGKELYFDPDYEQYERDIEKENEEFFKNLKWEDAPEEED